MGTTFDCPNGNQVLKPKSSPVFGSKSGTSFWVQIGNQFLGPDLTSKTGSREPDFWDFRMRSLGILRVRKLADLDHTRPP
jgi:hypothetical protein